MGALSKGIPIDESLHKTHVLVHERERQGLRTVGGIADDRVIPVVRRAAKVEFAVLLLAAEKVADLYASLIH